MLALVTYEAGHGFEGYFGPSNCIVTIDSNDSINATQAPSSTDHRRAAAGLLSTDIQNCATSAHNTSAIGRETCQVNCLVSSWGNEGHLHLQNDSSSFHPVDPLIRAFGPRVLYHAKGRCHPNAGEGLTRLSVGPGVGKASGIRSLNFKAGAQTELGWELSCIHDRQAPDLLARISR